MNELNSPDWWKAINSELIYEHANKNQYDLAYPHYDQSNLDTMTCAQSYPITNNDSIDMCYINSDYCYPEMQSYAPCEGPKPWNFAYCYGSYGEPACQFANMVDMEDFM